jgi:hypothetical protein
VESLVLATRSQYHWRKPRILKQLALDLGESMHCEKIRVSLKESSCLLALLAFVSCVACAQTAGSSSAGKKGAGGNAAGANAPGGTKKQNSDTVHDVVTNTFTTRNACITKEGVKQTPYDVSADLATLAAGKELDWTTGNLHALVSYYYDALSMPDSQAVYIFHIVTWMRHPKDAAHPDQDDETVDNPPYALVSSDWHAYVTAGGNKLKQSGFKGSGDPQIYGKKRAIVIAVDTFSSDKKGNLISTYNTSVTQGIPENRQDFGQLAGALLGISGNQAQAQSGAIVTTCGIFVGAKLQDGTKKLPYDLSVAVATVDATGTKPKDQTSSQNVVLCRRQNPKSRRIQPPARRRRPAGMAFGLKLHANNWKKAPRLFSLIPVSVP